MVVSRDLRLDRLVAIKVLPEQAVASPDRQARFEQEAKAASALNRPNIITVYEIDRARDHLSRFPTLSLLLSGRQPGGF